MKITTVSLVMLAALAWSTNLGRAQGVTLNFASNPGGFIEFGGSSDSFQFVSAPNGYQWSITSEEGGSSSIGLLGLINNGPFTYGPITSSFGGMVQSADVLGPLGQLVISSPSGNLTATINWEDVTTYLNAVGVFNASLDINVTGITYTGTNPDLQLLTAKQPGVLDLSFQFNPGESLTQLSSGAGGYDTSFSGSVAVVPEPATVTLSILGGLGLLGLLRRRM
ncbi:MAG: hypothetical protein ABSH48_00830 [Verrucomicrobiota bacterium]|jgi:hypothetical protein